MHDGGLSESYYQKYDTCSSEDSADTFEIDHRKFLEQNPQVGESVSLTITDNKTGKILSQGR